MPEAKRADGPAERAAEDAARDRDLILELPVAAAFAQGEALLLNRAAARLTGYSRSEITTVTEWFDQLFGTRAARVRSLHEEDRANDFPGSRTLRLTHRSGEERFAQFAAQRIPHGEIWVLQDVTRWKQAEAALRESESKTRAILETCIDCIVTIDERGTMLSVNTATEKTFGYGADELIGRNISILMTEPDNSRHTRYLERYLQSGEARIIGVGREVLARRKDGATIPVHLGVGEMILPGGKLFVGLIRDLTPFKEVQRKLIEAESLAAIGEMAASVAHEIKNPLAAISGVVQVLEDSDAIHPEYREIVSELVDRLDRLDDTVKRLLVFSKPMTPDADLVDIFEVTRQVLRSAGREDHFRNIRFEIEGSAADARIDLVLYDDLIHNLLYNAADAMTEGGEVRVTVRPLQDKVSIQLSDTGSGIEEQVLDRVFQPFFTTSSHGTGLGLAICKKIAEAHDGSISLESRPGQGTRVTLLFPLASGRA